MTETPRLSYLPEDTSVIGLGWVEAVLQLRQGKFKKGTSDVRAMAHGNSFRGKEEGLVLEVARHSCAHALCSVPLISLSPSLQG